jgi:hypothetical protein
MVVRTTMRAKNPRNKPNRPEANMGQVHCYVGSGRTDSKNFLSSCENATGKYLEIVLSRAFLEAGL